jgi:AraC family transcriptional regulator, regulatory protein of adaptative response / DNA-3-methyladenine glycosylase II
VRKIWRFPDPFIATALGHDQVRKPLDEHRPRDQGAGLKTYQMKRAAIMRAVMKHAVMKHTQMKCDHADLDHDACYRAVCQRDARFDGRFFTGVKTTGVYCRPVCPARTPLSKNVVFFPTAAAAQEAGLRPCLRCRPETAPDLGAWRGTSNTVSRALSLIELGALDEADVDALAGRLGVGERQLRRLFRQHLGASPVAVAQTRRVLLAKQLIHETRLPMAEVAFASGFGSIRRFNETFRALFGRPPGELRRLAGSDLPVGPAGEIVLLLRYQPPYDWEATIAFLQRRAIAGVEHVTPERYARSVELDGLQGTVAVEPAGGCALRTTVCFPKLSALPTIIARLRRVFDLGADPVAIARHLAKDPTLAPLVKARPGLRVPGAWDGFELAMRAVLGQQITVTAAARLAACLVAAHGARLSAAHGHLTHVFPRASTIARADLAPLGMPRSRAAALSAVAAAAVADPHLFDANRGLDDAVRRLRAIRGVGEWTAQYIALRQLREPDAFPAADLGLIRAMAGREGRGPSSSELLDRADAWRPWRAYAAQHLWASA